MGTSMVKVKMSFSFQFLSTTLKRWIKRRFLLDFNNFDVLLDFRLIFDVLLDFKEFFDFSISFWISIILMFCWILKNFLIFLFLFGFQ